MSIPTLTIRETVKKQIRSYSRRIGAALRIIGPFNIQFLVKNSQVLVIECNLRASRSMPFVSKATGTNLMDLAARAIMGNSVVPGEGRATKFSVKAPQFSFTRLDNADPVTGVEMVSTGEVACFGETFEAAFVDALLASNFYVPTKGDAILVTMGKTRRKIIPYAKTLAQNGYKIYATRHTAEDLQRKGIPATMLYKVRERKKPNILDYLTSKEIKLVINIPSTNGEEESRQIIEDEYVIRRKAAEFGIPIVTNLELAKTLVKSLIRRNVQRRVRVVGDSTESPLAEAEQPPLWHLAQREAKDEPPIAVAPVP